MATLTAADYAVIGVLILISSAIGVYYWLVGGRQKSTEVIKLYCTFLFYITYRIFMIL